MRDWSVEYIIASTGPNQITVTKFEVGHEEPLETYHVDMSKPTTRPCDCAAWRSGKTRPCKHGKMAMEWLAAGEPDLGSYRCVGVGKDWVFATLNKERKL